MYEEDLTTSIFQSEPENASAVRAPYFSTAALDPALSDLENPWGPPSDDPLSIGTILRDVELAPIYETTFNLAKPRNNQITKDALDKVLSVSGLSSTTIEKILTMTLPHDRSGIDREAFCVTLALVALGQKNMEISLETIISHKQDLPVPSLPNLSSIDFTTSTTTGGLSSTADKIEDSTREQDPWQANDIASTVNPMVPNESDKPSLKSLPAASSSLDTLELLDDRDLISVQISLQKGGLIFKHVNYIVESKQRLSTVTRRYSDFWWLLEILTKRYPSRMLPTLPPKRIGGDEAFLERRRRGLSRFINFIARHPVLKNDDVTIAFLTEPTDMGSYRKLHEINVEGEFTKIEVTSQMSTEVPSDLEEKLSNIRERLDASAEYYTTQCVLMERMTKRQEGSCEDLQRYSRTLVSLGENEGHCYDSACYQCPEITNGLNIVSDSFKRVSLITKEAVDSSVNGVIDNLRRQKEIIVAFKELLDRKDKLVSSDVDTLTSRIKSNQGKIDHLRSSGGADKEIQRLVGLVEQDQKEIQLSRQREVFVRYCLWRELQFYHQNVIFVTRLYQQYVTDQIRFTTVLNQAWKDLSATVYDLPSV